MDRDTKKQAQLACQISLGLMAGIFSIVPTVAASPVQDTSSSLNTGATVTTSGTTTTVAGNQTNNVVAWKDFSVASGETVHFNGSTPNARDYNYLNVVTGANTSRIAGTIEGGNNVYIVNQHGVIIDKNATVNVGNLYVSTKAAATDADTVKAAITNNTGSAVLSAATTGTAVSDVVNLGTIQAGNVQVEGKNIRFLDSAKVKTVNGGVNTNVTLNARQADTTTGTAAGYVHVGNETGSDAGYTSSGTIDYYTLVNNAEGLQNIKNDLTKNYMLSQNIDASTIDNFEPIGNDTSTPFTGKFDGMFYEVQNLNVSTDGNAGLFGNTSGARIENVGVVGATIAATGDSGYAGSVVGNAIGNTAIQNVYSETSVASDNTVKGSVSGETAGGLVGYLEGTLSGSYNTTSVKTTFEDGVASGVVGRLESGSITDAYNTGTVAGERSTLSGITYAPSGASVTRVYNTYKALKLVEGQQSGLTSGKTFDATDTTSSADTAIDKAKHISTYIKSGTNTSNADKSWTVTNGNTTVSAISTDGTTNTTWRLYEGQSTPLLTAFFQGTTTADYSYNYFTKDGTMATTDGFAKANKTPTVAVNGGEDLSGFTYNGQYLKVAAPKTDDDGNAVTSTTTSTDADILRGYVTFGGNAGEADEDGNYFVNVASDGIKNVVLKNVQKVDKTWETAEAEQALVYSGQHGYNIVGGNVQIDKREITAKSGTVTGVNKEYDGTADATDAFTNAHASVSFDGLLANDKVSITNLTATYADKNVGTKKTITVAKKANAKTFLTGDSADNYTFKESSLSNLTVQGDITPRSLYVKLKSDGSFDKFYDGTADVTSDDASVANNVSLDKTRILTVDNKVDDVSLDTSNAGKVQYYNGDDTVSDSNVATNTTDDYTIRYTGLKLTGADAGNYQLVADGTTTVLATGTTSTDAYLTAKGRINQRIIDPTAFQVQKSDGTKYTATKTYDGSSSFTLDSDTKLVPPSSTSATDDGYGFADGETINFDLATGESAEFQDDSGSATSQVADATKLAAKVTATAGNDSTKLENYVWGKDGDTLTTYNATTKAGLYDVTTTGNITRRAITVEVTQPKDVSIDKTYDSTTAVNTTKNPEAAIFGTDGYVNYTSTSLQLANGADGTNTTADGTSFTVTPTYDNANVNRDSNGKAIARNINYTVTLSGANAVNYTLNGTDLTSDANSVKMLGSTTGAKGIINPKELSSSFGEITKTYDGTTDVPADKLSATLSDGIYDADKGKVSLKSGYKAVFQSKNVNGDGTTWTDANKKKWTNYVNYSGLALEGTNAGNYTIAETAKGGGTITKRTLKAGDFEYTFGDITKTYDGNTMVDDADKKLLTAKVTATGDYFKQGDTNYTSATAVYKDKNSNNGAKQDVNYTVTISDDGSGNYDFSGFTDGKLTDTVTDTNGGTITRRALYASVTNTDPFTKTYDGTTDAGLAAGDASVTLTGDADHADTTGFVSGDGAANASTGAFDTKDVAYDTKDVAYDTTNTDKIAAKNVNYTIKLSGDNAQGNYIVYDASDKTKELAYDKAGVLQGTGIINPATITAKFGTITKVYDGTKTVAGKKNLNGDTTESQFTNSLDGVLSPNGTKDDVTIKADIANAIYTDENKGIGDRDITYKFTLGGNDLRNYKLSTDTSADGYNKTHAGDYTTTIGGNSIQTKTLTKDDISVAWGNVTKVYDGSKNVAYTHKAEDGYFDGEIGSKTTSDFISTTTDNTTGLKLGGISIAKGTTGYTVSDVALFDSADTDATKATFQFTLSDDVANNFDFRGITDIYDASTRTLTRSTSDDNATASITAKQVKLDFAPLKDHSQVYNGSATLVDNSQTAPAAAAKDLSSTITGVTGLVNNEAQSVLGLSVAGAFVDTTTDGTTVLAKDAGTGKSIQYDVTLTNKNYTFYPNGTDVADAMTGTVDTTGKAITYLGTTANGYAGTITPKTLTVTADSLVKTYDGTADVLDSSLDNVEFEGLVGSEKLTPGHQTSTVEGLKGTYLASDDYGAEEVEYDSNGNKTTKAVQLSNIDKALANASGANSTTLISNYTVKNPTQTYTIADGAGRIDPLEITKADIKASFVGTITKEYDNTDDVLNPEKYYKIQVSKTVNGQTIQTDLGYKLSSAKYDNQQKDVTTGHGVTYTFDGLTSNALKNFVVGAAVQADYATGTTKTTTGNITPRKLYASITTPLGDGGLQKTYDGNNTISGTGKTQSELDHNITVTNLLPTANDDGATVDIVTTFDDANVAYKTDDTTGKKAITTKDVHYTLSIGGTGKASNYVFYDKEGDDGKSLLDATTNTYRLTDADAGKITPATLTVDETKTGVATKTFDNNANVKTLPTFAFTGFVNDTDEAALGFDSSKVTGAYGTLADGVFTADKNVNRTANATTGEADKDEQGNAYYYKGVQYTGFQDTLDALRDGTGNVIAGNYTIANTKYFEEALEKGVIKPLAITQSAIREIWADDITKPYDTTATVNNATDQLAYKVLLGADGTTKDANVTKGDGAELVTIAYTLSTPATYNDANVKTANQVTYDIQAIDPAELQNYAMGAEAKAVIVKTHTLKNGDKTSDGIQHTVGITPKVLRYGLGDDGSETVLSRTYNGKTKGVENTLKITDGIFGQDTGVTLTFDEETEAGNYGKYGKYNSPDIDATKITYKVKLAGNDAGNYTLNATKTHAGDVGSATEYDTLDAAAEITQRTVYVGFADGKGTGIDKTYDGTMDVAAKYKNDVALVAEDTTKKTGVVTADVTAGLKLNNNAINVVYDDANVNRYDDGNVTTRGVYFSNFQLTGNDTKAKNYKTIAIASGSKQSEDGTKLIGSGTISPATVTVSYDNVTPVSQEYTGESAFTTDTQTALANAMKNNAAGMVAGEGIDTLGLSVTGDYTYDGKKNIHTNEYLTDETGTTVADGDLGLSMSVAWTNGNYDVVFAPTNTTTAAKTLTQDAAATAQKGSDGTVTGFAKTVTTTQGTITQKTLTVTGNSEATKVYTGSEYANGLKFTGNSDSDENTKGVTFTGIVEHDKNVNSLIAMGNATYYNEAGTSTDANAGVAEDSDELAKHKVKWQLTLANKDYKLSTDTAEGTGTITRAPLTVVTDPVQGRYGQTPTFTGHVDDKSWQTEDDRKEYNTRAAADPQLFVYNTEPGTSSRGGQSQPVYGWYHDSSITTPTIDTTKPGAAGWYRETSGDGYATDGTRAYRNFGNYGRNYTMVQQPGQYTSQADGPNTDILNPARRVRPDMEVYNYVTHDDVGTVIRDPKAGIEYQAGGTSLSTDGSAAYSGTMTVEGTGEVVNLTQSGTTASANRVDLTGDGANYTLSGAENVPTADVTVADVTEDVASATTTASATAAAGTTSATSATSADDTTVTDDDDDVVKAAAESSDEREAEATVEYADAAPSLFSEAITGTKVAS